MQCVHHCIDKFYTDFTRNLEALFVIINLLHSTALIIFASWLEVFFELEDMLCVRSKR